MSILYTPWIIVALLCVLVLSALWISQQIGAVERYLKQIRDILKAEQSLGNETKGGAEWVGGNAGDREAIG